MADQTYRAIWTYAATIGEPGPNGQSTVEGTTTVTDTVSDIPATVTVSADGSTAISSIVLRGTAVPSEETPAPSTTEGPISDPATPSAPEPSTSSPLSDGSTTTTTSLQEETMYIPRPPVTITRTVASIQSSVSSTSPTPDASHTADISPGGIAGVGIACAVAGAILASLFFCFVILGRRTGDPDTGTSSSRHRPARPSKSKPRWQALRRHIAPSTNPWRALEASLPQPLPESEIVGGLHRFGVCVTNHAHGFFHTGAAVAAKDLSDEYLVQLLGPKAPVGPAELIEALIDPATRPAAVRFLLAWCILRHVQTDSDPCKSLLPPEVAESLESMAMNETRGRQAHYILESRWRQLTACLMSSTYNPDTMSPSDPRQHNISDLTIALDTVLAPLASRLQDASRRQDLEALVVRGAHLGWRLFSQPTTWVFDWRHGGGGGGEKGGLAVLPAVVQTGDDQGRQRAQAEVFSEAQVVTLSAT